jgi:hypothetical protein
MLLPALLLAFPQEVAATPAPPRGRAEVWRLDRVETLDGDALENVTLIVREGAIEKIGQALIIPDGARVHDLRDSGMVASPPLVLTHANFLIQDQRGSGNASRWRAVDSLWLAEGWEKDLLREGVLIAGVDPPGSGLPGRTSVIEAGGGWPRPQALVNDLHLKLTMSASQAAKDVVRRALKEADEAIEKEKQAREEWEKARAEWINKQKEKEQKEKEQSEKEQSGEKKEEQGGKSARAQDEVEKAPPETFEPPAFPPDLQAVVEWVRQERLAQVWIGSAADFVHWQDVLDKRELPYELVLRHVLSQNFHEIAEQLAQTKVRLDVPALITFLPFTRIRTNLPAELVRSGVERLVLSPAGDSLRDLRDFRGAVTRLVSEGLERKRAFEAITLEPARALGQEGRIQALKAGAPANFVVWSGDPLNPMSRAMLVVKDGKIVYDREKENEEEARR